MSAITRAQVQGLRRYAPTGPAHRVMRPSATGEWLKRDDILALFRSDEASGTDAPATGRRAGRAFCGDCDGVGWVEGGTALTTTCRRCSGSGWEP